MPGVISDRPPRPCRAAAFPACLLVLLAILSVLICPAAAEENGQIVFKYTANENGICLDIRNQTNLPVFSGDVHMAVTTDSGNIQECELNSCSSQNTWILPGERLCVIIHQSVSSNQNVSFSYSREDNPAHTDSDRVFVTESEARILRENGFLTGILAEYINPSADSKAQPRLIIALYDNEDRPLFAEEIRIAENDEICPAFGRLQIRWDPFRSSNPYLFILQDQAVRACAFSLWDADCDYDYRLLEDGTAEITGMNGEEKNITVPPVIGGYPVTGIASYALQNKESIRNIAISEGIRTIGDYAFQGCEALKCLYLPSSVESIGVNPVYSCHVLTTIAFQKENTRYSIVNGALVNQQEQHLISYPLGRKDSQYKIPAEIRSIGANAFAYRSSLTQIIFPENLVEIGDFAFQSSDAITSVTLPGSLRRLGNNPFADCTNLKKIVLEGDSKEVFLLNGVLFSESGRRLVLYPPWLTDETYTIPEGTTVIGDNAFSSASHLCGISMPDTVETIGDNSFSQCINLKSIELPDSIISIGRSAFSRCFNLAQIRLPSGLTKISNYTFRDCSSLSEIYLPEGLTEIEYCAFEFCTSLSYLYLPASLEKIGLNAFTGCLGFTADVEKESYAEKYCRENQIRIKVTRYPDNYVQPTEEPLPDWLKEDNP